MVLMLRSHAGFATKPFASSQRVHCFQEQWEIYKLDPAYRCTVYPGGMLSSITRINTEEQNPSVCDPSGTKRARALSPEPSEPILPKRARSYRAPSGAADDSDQTDTDSEEDEVEEMIIDDEVAACMPKSSYRKLRQSNREALHTRRQWRWNMNKKRQKKYRQDIPMSTESSFSMRVDSEEHFNAYRGMSPIAEQGKRKGMFVWWHTFSA